MNCDEGNVGNAKVPGAAEDCLLVMVVGEDIDTGIVVVEAFLEDFAKLSQRLLILFAKRKKVFAGFDDSQLMKGYEYLKAKGDSLGIGMEQRLFIARDPYGEIHRWCSEIAKEFPKAIFCFFDWGIEEGKQNLMERLRAEKIRTTTIHDLIKSLKGGSPNEC